MKKILSLFAIMILAIASAVNSAPATYGATDAVYEYGGLDYTISSSAFDTLSGVDSTILLSSRSFSPDWQYILVRDKFTGTAADGSGTDSVKLDLRLDVLTSSGSLVYSTSVDSFTVAAGEQVFLPIFGSIIGSKIRIKLIGYTGNGGQLILNGFHIYKRRPVTLNKMWK